MFERNVYDEYKLYCEQRFIMGDFEGFTAQGKHYFFVSVDNIEDEELKEMIQMGNHLRAIGDHEVATFVPTVNNALTGFIDGQNCILFQLPQYFSRSKKEKSLGHQLARQHQSGKTYLKAKKTYSLWTDFWINRLSQLDILYGNISSRNQKSSFDQAFMTSFPYYIGRTENAIQYVVDTDLDFGSQSQNEPKTICHYQFTPRTWLTIDNQTLAAVKSPTDFVYDHPSRDLAELTRTMIRQEQPLKKIKKIISDYESIEKISPKAWRYMFGRLLFPIEYFQIVEGYYRSVDDEQADEYTERLFDLFASEQQVEKFLNQFHAEVVPEQWQQYIPEVDWLKNFRKVDSKKVNNYFYGMQ